MNTEATQDNTKPLAVASVTIRGFKSIVEATIDLGRLNVFIGANGAGKTVVLEAIGVLGAAADGRVDDVTLQQRGVRPGVPGLYKNAFPKPAVPRVIALGAASGGSPAASYDVCLSNPIRVAATPWKFSNENLAIGEKSIVSRSPRGATLWSPKGKGQSFRPKESVRGVADTPNPLWRTPDAVLGFLDALRRYAIYDPQTPVLRGIEQEVSALDPVGLHGGRLAEGIDQLLSAGGRIGAVSAREMRELIDWASGVGAAPPTPDLISPSLPAAKLVTRFRDRYMKEGRNYLSAYDASEGALYVLFAFVLVFHPRSSPVFAIENIDHALHPRLARKLVDVLSTHVKTAGKQVLLTTHNPLVLDGLNLADDDVRLFTVDRNQLGHTVIRRLEYSSALAAAQEKGLSLSQLWTRGLIGAVPNLI